MMKQLSCWLQSVPSPVSEFCRHDDCSIASRTLAVVSAATSTAVNQQELLQMAGAADGWQWDAGGEAGGNVGERR